MSTTVRAWLPWGIGAALVLAGLAVAFRPQPVPVDTAPAAVPPASAPPPPELRCGSAPLPGATP